MSKICSYVWRMNNKGFTLTELLGTMVIVGIVVAIAVPAIREIMVNSEKEACNVNSVLIEKGYETYLIAEQIEHLTVAFNQYVLGMEGNIHAGEAVLSYIDGEVQCSLHPRNNPPQEDNDEEKVPFL